MMRPPTSDPCSSDRRGAATVGRQPRRSRGASPQGTGLLFALPALLALALSVMDDAGRLVGSRNYQRVVSAPLTLTALWNTFYYVGASLVLQVTLGTAVGIMLNQKFRGRGIARSLILVPWIVPGIVAATTWAWMFHSEFGIVNYLMQRIGIVEGPIGWLTSPTLVLPSLIAVNVWKMFPFVAVMVLAGLQAVPETHYEAARMDGAGFEQFRFGEAAALSVLFFGVVLALIALYIRLLGRRAEA